LNTLFKYYKSQVPLRYSWFEAGSKLVADQLRTR